MLSFGLFSSECCLQPLLFFFFSFFFFWQKCVRTVGRERRSKTRKRITFEHMLWAHFSFRAQVVFVDRPIDHPHAGIDRNSTIWTTKHVLANGCTNRRLLICIQDRYVRFLRGCEGKSNMPAARQISILWRGGATRSGQDFGCRMKTRTCRSVASPLGWVYKITKTMYVYNCMRHPPCCMKMYCIPMSKSQLLKQLGWLTLAWRRRRAKLIYFWKLVNNQGPPCLSSRIPKSVNNRCEYSLRNTGTVELPACSSSLYLSSFIPSSCLLWNSLPPDVVQALLYLPSPWYLTPMSLLIVSPLVLVSSL